MMRILGLIALFPAGAFAQDAAAPSLIDPNSQYASFLPLIFIFAIFYFLLIRPQQRKMREHGAMLTSLAKGDEVVTGGGIVGRITRVEADDKFTVEIAKGVEVRVLKSSVSAVLSKDGVPVVPVGKKAPSKNDNSAPSRNSVANDN